MHEPIIHATTSAAPRRFRISLWGLFVVMTVACIFLATPGFVLAVFALVVAAEIAAICFAVFISWPVARLMDAMSALRKRRRQMPENDLAEMARDDRFHERRTLFQPPSLMS